MTQINGMDADALRRFQLAASEDRSRADREPVVAADWVGGGRSRVTDTTTGISGYIGGDDELNPMRMLLATLAACDVDLVATRATLLGLELESVQVEARGHFNVRRYVGVDDPEGPGYDRISYTVRIRAPGASPEQLDELRRACEVGSPVGDTLQRQVDLSLEFEAG